MFAVLCGSAQLRPYQDLNSSATCSRFPEIPWGRRAAKKAFIGYCGPLVNPTKVQRMAQIEPEWGLEGSEWGREGLGAHNIVQFQSFTQLIPP